ncbi:hypothetical protein NEPAR06_0536 [Nematocida parisii]|uniref:Uncharacterized protein n=1 Tax=Nematocida parisii (strain ERTm3) TaxID=935791 RepID=I3EI65_NEMP3|nr:uncharacterized protein NEPG_01876 [Nematocida parisii ERTm1]EIJ88912.1 hypothetical protein NEQG_00731 [Nematocida parisii ERTm3]KAI5126253.1 hypothetical protein NEPAR08_0324 [Nematocida parisii]EIJ93534.1 hypothetical protein NEPG_01876 [Nematocida parisii ERTm1]KAI5127120.1 hypothetical protein NEPAR03_0787 [Nematocida parisii]KAI5140035.1 hypothetical protein NEPAR04_0009 [Nematocida parisii]|eukprot:XP_013059704.1 hypothetical protein NEPG_01876 [Nematocida parisii ERTm1]
MGQLSIISCIKYFMREINTKDVAAVMDIVSYEYITPSDAKSLSREFASANAMLSDEIRLFLKNFYTSVDQ